MNTRRKLILVLTIAVLAVGFDVRAQRSGEGGTIVAALRNALDVIKGDVLLAHTKKLASDEFEGRAPGTRGEMLTVNYLVDQFKRSGLKPGNPDGTFVQNVPLVGYHTVPQIDIEAGLEKPAFKFRDDFVHDFPALRKSASVKNAGVVFAGYGIVAPEFGWDDYKGVDVRNKLVIVLSGEPSKPENAESKELDSAFFKGEIRTYYSALSFKYDLAVRKGAAGILAITDPAKANTFSLFKTFAMLEGLALKPQTANTNTLISGIMTVGSARRVFSAASQDYDQLEASANLSGFTAVTTSAKANISVKSKLRSVVSQNVVARIEGDDPSLRNEYIIYTSHWDHLGKDTNLKGDQIYNGAIDDAIGTSQMLEIAKGFASLPNKPKRSVLFLATTSEEKGFLGARHYAQNPLFPISKTVANINLDGGNAWGRTRDVLSANYGLSTLDDTLAEAAKLQGRLFLRESLGNGGLFFASDQIEFAKVGVPAIFPFSGSEYSGKPKDFGEKKWSNYGEKDYHQVSDEVKPDWDLSGAAEDAQWLLIAGYLIAQSDEKPKWSRSSEFGRDRRF